MPTRLLSSLSFQISIAFLLLLFLFTCSSLYTIGSLESQVKYDKVVDVAARLELTAQQLHNEAMNYKQNAPRDYRTYYRDLRLYYQNLTAHVDTLDQLFDTFMSGDLSGAMSGGLPWSRQEVSDGVKQAIGELKRVWTEYREGLFAALGPDRDEPRLEYAAEHNMANHGPLRDASHALTESLRRWAADEHRRVRRISLTVIGVAVLLSLTILAVVHFTALSPLKRTISGFQRVADGDFEHQLDVRGSSEARDLTASFNRLSDRLHLLFKLIGRLQQGNDLDEVIGFLSRELSSLLRIDWIGVTMLSADGTTARLDVSYQGGEPERTSRELFPVRGTLLEQALEQDMPMHIPDVEATAASNPSYRFLRTLAERGLRDAVFLPLNPQTQTPIPAVVVFATRTFGRYDSAHLRFLGNIAHLITQSFGRTVRLAEHGRLANIGELASGIAHELRTPLTTVGLALDYFDRQELTEGARKRLELARQESKRMRRLLDEILLYAKPVSLELKPLKVTELIQDFIEEQATLAESRGQVIRLGGGRSDAQIMGDRDRLTQILANLTQNACEAAPRGAVIGWVIRDDPAMGTVSLEVHNPGEPIPPDVLERITEPFFSTKRSGTGLGLAIAKRLSQLLGGELAFTSDEVGGTRASVILPKMERQQLFSNS